MNHVLMGIARALGRVNRGTTVAARNLAALMVAIMLLLALAQIISRGLFVHSLDWAEELARVALVWSVLLVAPYAYRKGAHVAILSFALSLPERLQVAVGLLLNLLVVWILAVFLSESAAFWRRGLHVTAASLDVKMAWIYWVLPLALVLLLLVAAELLVRLVLHWRRAPSGIALEGAMPAVVED